MPMLAGGGEDEEEEEEVLCQIREGFKTSQDCEKLP